MEAERPEATLVLSQHYAHAQSLISQAEEQMLSRHSEGHLMHELFEREAGIRRLLVPR